jgi:membrane associated rhomboid family serine protease
MGLADRNYMRDEYHPPRVATKLIVVLIVAFVLESVLIFYFNVDVLKHLGLTVAGIKAGKVWQLITFQFLHSAPWPWHVLFNCLGLYFFGRPVEERLGSKKFVILYLSCGVVGGLLQVATSALLPNHYDVPVVGASAGICGMIAIFCSLSPMQELTTWIYFFPVTIRARYFLLFLGLFSLFGTFIPFDNIAHAAHLGGILLGMAYVRWGETTSQHLRGLNPFHTRQRKQELIKAASFKMPRWTRHKSEESDDDAPEEFISREVDPILDKISAHGIQSLTERERKILEAARNKMAKR